MTTSETAARAVAVGDLPAVHVTIDQVVAFNVRHWRKAAGMTQEELGEQIGLSGANMSAIERSADTGRERRRFDAQTIALAAIALGVPVIALFLPPAGDGVTRRYLFTAPAGTIERDLNMTDLMQAVIPDMGYETPVLDAYRKRFHAAITYYTDPEFASQVARSLREATPAEVRAEQAARLRERQAELENAAKEFADIAAALEEPPGGQS